MKELRTCRLCRGEGLLPMRSPLDDAMECPDCDGLGVVEKGSEIWTKQQKMKRNRPREADNG